MIAASFGLYLPVSGHDHGNGMVWKGSGLTFAELAIYEGGKFPCRGLVRVGTGGPAPAGPLSRRPGRFPSQRRRRASSQLADCGLLMGCARMRSSSSGRAVTSNPCVYICDYFLSIPAGGRLAPITWRKPACAGPRAQAGYAVRSATAISGFYVSSSVP